MPENDVTDNIVLNNLQQPEVLEKMYRRDARLFTQHLREAMRQNADSEVLKVWSARINFQPANEVAQQAFKESRQVSLTTLLGLCLLAGILVKIPAFISVDEEWFYGRFAAPVVVFVVMVYFIIRNQLPVKYITVLAGSALAGFVYAGLLPKHNDSDSVLMALIHLPLFFFTLLAVSFMASQWQTVESRLEFIRYVGELLILSVLVLLGGMFLTGITLGLFGIIGIHIERWYYEYVVVVGVASAPLVATYLYDVIMHRKSRIASMLANVFSPLFLLTVAVYLFATLLKGKSPFNDREFLIVINGLLLVILALTIFSIAGKNKPGKNLSDYINVALVTVTLIIAAIALTAVVYRWTEFGATFNRMLVCTTNILICIHLCLILWQYVKHLKADENYENLKAITVRYLPVYSAWTVIVIFILPVVYSFQ